jgi:protein SCO1/2
MRRRWWLAPVIASAVVLASCAGSDEPEDLTGMVRADPLQVGAVTLPAVGGEGAGAPFQFRAPDGELLVTLFGYTSCPDVCPATLGNLRIALQRVGNDAAHVSVAFVTVDPGRDTPEVLSAYLGSFLTRFHAVRTEVPAELAAAEEAFLASSSVTTSADGRVEVTHTGTAYVVDPSGTVILEWPFGVTSDAMADDLSILLDRSTTT